LGGPAHPDLDPNGPLPNPLFDLPAQNQDPAPAEIPEVDFPQISIPDINHEFTINNDPQFCLDFTPVELELMLRSDTETVLQFYDQVAQSQVEYDNAHQQTFTEDTVTPPVVSSRLNTLIELTLPIFASDTVVYEQKRLLNLEIKCISDEFIPITSLIIRSKQDAQSVTMMHSTSSAWSSCTKLWAPLPRNIHSLPWIKTSKLKYSYIPH